MAARLLAQTQPQARSHGPHSGTDLMENVAGLPREIFVYTALRTHGDEVILIREMSAFPKRTVVIANILYLYIYWRYDFLSVLSAVLRNIQCAEITLWCAR